MKVLIIMPYIGQGGAEFIAVRTSLELQKLGHRVKIAALYVNFSKMHGDARNIEYITFSGKLGDIFQKNKFFLYFLGPFFLLILVLKQISWADILFPQSLPAYWVASVLSKCFGKKVIWLCNEPPRKRKISDVPIYDFLMWKFADSFVEKLFVKGIDKIIVYSEVIKREVKLRYGKEAEMIRLGIDFNFFNKKDKSKENELKEKYKLSGKKLLLMVGKLHPQKNQRFGLDVLVDVLKSSPKAVLVLVGEGPDRIHLERKVKQLNLRRKVLFVGFCDPATVSAWYGLCDVVLFPSAAQTAISAQSWGFIPFEALCRKKISIISEGCGSGEVLGKEKIGIIRPLEVEKFSKAIIDVLNKSSYYRRMASRGQKYVKNNLSWDIFGKEIERVLRISLHKNPET